MKGRIPKGPPPTAPRPIAGPRRVGDTPGHRSEPPAGGPRPLWQELVTAVAPIVTTAVCDGLRDWMKHRRELRDGKPEKATERPS